MLKKLLIIIFIFSVSSGLTSYADEGMWLPLLIKRLNYSDMQKLGLKLTPEEIYSVNNSSLKDAIVNFGGFCTGEVISKEGLILTNHHCGFDAIQSQSSVENDILTNGFWAKTREDEKPIPGLTVTFLIRMEDVTEKILGTIEAGMDANQIAASIEENSMAIQQQAVAGTHYTAEVKPFFEGNAYYLFVYETFTDVRMVGAPPSSIGKFGGDTDNWMWPRHTGDFSLFRVYMSSDGKPAEYSKENIPLKPKHHLTISLEGVKPGDFAMIMGYPGSTERYLTSEGVKLAYEQTNPARVKIREKRLALMKEAMDADPKIRIMYAEDYASVSNYYKYFIGQNQGLKRLNVIDKKKQEEKKFTEWVNADPERQKIYGDLLNQFASIYKDYSKVNLPYVYLEEAAFGNQLLLTAYRFNPLYSFLANNPNTNKDTLDAVKEPMLKIANEHFKDYYAPLDKKIFAALLKMYYEDIPKQLHPSVFSQIEKKYKGNFDKYADAVFQKSIFADEAKMKEFMANPTAAALEKDPGFATMSSILGDFRQIVGPYLGNVYSRLDATNNLYLKAILEMRKDEKLYPDANFTMRLTYGTVQDYYPRDGVKYLYLTTLNGVISKNDPDNPEFVVPDKLIELYNKKDFGRYGINDSMPVCFITNNDITGGNSGSPVMNAKGHLIGCAFDGNWEAMSGDIIFEPELQRTISVDIRYILFIIDKFANAGHLIDEMTIAQPEETSAKGTGQKAETINNGSK